MKNEDIGSTIDHGGEMKKEDPRGNINLRHTTKDGMKITGRSSLLGKNKPDKKHEPGKQVLFSTTREDESNH